MVTRTKWEKLVMKKYPRKNRVDRIRSASIGRRVIANLSHNWAMKGDDNTFKIAGIPIRKPISAGDMPTLASHKAQKGKAIPT